MTTPVDRVRWNTDPEYRAKLRRWRRNSNVSRRRRGVIKRTRQQPKVRAQRYASKCRKLATPAGRANWNAYVNARNNAPLAIIVRKAMHADPAVAAALKLVWQLERARRKAAWMLVVDLALAA